MINVPSPMHNDCFDQKNWSTCKTKRKVIKQVYRIKKDGRLNKNSDLTLDIEKPTIEKSSAILLIKLSPIMSMSQITQLNNNHVRLGGNMILKWLVLKAPV
jgi:hypothetical protein